MFTSLINISLVKSEIYKWTDENGKTHFSDKAEDKNAKKIKQAKKLSDDYLNESRLRTQKLLDFQKRFEQSGNDKKRSEKIKRNETKKEKLELKLLCNEVSKDIRLLGKGRPTYYENKKGKKIFLSDSDKNTTIAKGKAFIRDNCYFD